ncbi:hypothetical protein Q5H91_03155 [Sphingomonas sp. KR1UV-12]|uniref:Type II secretion system protein n=1 Tax=Sphingomonas aurea TaxID=3063994 RepID=A0ABT9EHV1_9SPHN|nr:hypothetical protein [Sphingomonas sp. KR1UV-12]MDP1026198.1 hypothetical protein [Sphingomonas sp. KR1UV-12]
MSVISVLVFAGAVALAVSVILASIVPQWRRILRLASGRTEASFSFAPLRQLAQAERRIAVRRWAAMPVPASIHRLREAA